MVFDRVISNNLVYMNSEITLQDKIVTFRKLVFGSPRALKIRRGFFKKKTSLDTSGARKLQVMGSNPDWTGLIKKVSSWLVMHVVMYIIHTSWEQRSFPHNVETNYALDAWTVFQTAFVQRHSRNFVFRLSRYCHDVHKTTFTRSNTTISNTYSGSPYFSFKTFPGQNIIILVEANHAGRHFHTLEVTTDA